jgi:hypothetical protein
MWSKVCIDCEDEASEGGREGEEGHNNNLKKELLNSLNFQRGDIIELRMCER